MTRLIMAMAFAVLGVGGFVVAAVIAVSIGLNGYSQEESESVRQVQRLLFGIVGGGGVLGAVGAMSSLASRWIGSGLMLVGGIVSAAGVGIVASRWDVVHDSNAWAALAPLAVVLWLGSVLLWRATGRP